MEVIIYTDGGCDINKAGARNKGGFASCLFYENGDVIFRWGKAINTTNNRMELIGAIQALKLLSPDDHAVLYTDSQYVQKGITEWSHKWAKNNFADAKNPDLWQELYELNKNRNVDWYWVRGHSGTAGNELADTLCNQAMGSLAFTEKLWEFRANYDLSEQKHTHIARHHLTTSDCITNAMDLSDSIS